MADLLTKALNPTGMSLEEIELQVTTCTGFVKLIMGMANNCAYGVMMDALDQIRKHPRYADKRIKWLFEGKRNSVLDFYKRYRNRLRWPTGAEMHFFHKNFIPKEIREKKYGKDVTDEQLFEFWESTGALAYTKARPWVTSLQNKFRLSLLNHGVPNPEIVAWGLVGSSVLEMAVEVFERTMRSVHNAVPVLRIDVISDIFGAFNLKDVTQQWHKALYTLANEVMDYKLTSVEEKNITQGLNQLRELLASPDLPFDANIAAVEDYSDEIFRTKGEAKKLVRELSEMKNEAIEDIRQQKLIK